MATVKQIFDLAYSTTYIRLSLQRFKVFVGILDPINEINTNLKKKKIDL